LECGSGLSTLLLRAVAKNRGIEHIVFEHIELWSAKVQKQLDKYKLLNSKICHVPIKDFGDYSWYDISAATLPSTFSLVVCDGPPSSIKGGRYGLVPLMKDKFTRDCVILLDDADREQEHEIARQWQAKLNMAIEVIGESKPYLELNIQQDEYSCENISMFILTFMPTADTLLSTFHLPYKSIGIMRDII
jgi:hypothetical protein